MAGTAIYALAAERSHASAQRFLRRFVGPHPPDGLAQRVKQFGRRFGRLRPGADPESLLELLLADRELPHALFWKRTAESALSGAYLFFTMDGGLIAGISLAGRTPDVPAHLADLAETVDARFGYALPGEPPHDTMVEFREYARLSPPPKIFRGRLVSS